MAIPFYEPKTNNTANQQNINNNTPNNTDASAYQMYDQVDGIEQTTPPAQAVQIGVSIIPSVPTAFLTPPPSPSPAANGADFLTSATTPSASSYEQQALAWKILAITMCKALKEYYLQTSSSKDAFTNQTVQVLPNGQVQPLWK